MTTYGSDQTFILIDGYNVTNRYTATTENLQANVEDVTPFGVDWDEHVSVDVKQGTLAQSGFFDDAANSVHEALEAGNGAHRILCYGVEGNTLGRDFTGWTGPIQTNYSKQLSVKAVHKASATYQSHKAIEDGVILHPLGARTADGDTEATSFDAGDDSHDGGAGYLQVTALTLGGHDDLEVSILESSDDTTFVELLAFTAADSAPFAERISIPGDVEQYLAVAWDFTGSGSDPSATFFVGFARDGGGPEPTP